MRHSYLPVLATHVTVAAVKSPCKAPAYGGNSFNTSIIVSCLLCIYKWNTQTSRRTFQLNALLVVALAATILGRRVVLSFSKKVFLLPVPQQLGYRTTHSHYPTASLNDIKERVTMSIWLTCLTLIGLSVILLSSTSILNRRAFHI